MTSQQPPVNLEIGNKCRIYVALTALLHKPPEQSFHSYTLDLRTKFPLANGNLSNSSQIYWRDHALSLEKQLKETRERMQKVQLELQKQRETSKVQHKLGEEQRREEERQSNRPKKKRKMQVDSLPPPFDWNEAMRNLDPVLWPPFFRGELGMLNTLVRLSQSTPKENPRQKVFPLVKQALTLVGTMLKLALAQWTTPPSRNLLKELGSLVPLIIDQSLPLVLPAAVLDACVEAFVQTLHEQILLPSILHLGLLSDSATSSLLKRRAEDTLGPKRVPPATDVRPVLLGLCQGSLNSLKPYSQIQASVSILLSHSVLTQLKNGLKQLKPFASNHSLDKKPSTAAERVRRLAFKDTFWYLVSILNMCFCSVPASVQTDRQVSPLEEAARTAVLVSLAEMLENKDGKGLVSLVERNMLIGVVEQAWTNGWAPFGQQKDGTSTSSGGEEDEPGIR